MSRDFYIVSLFILCFIFVALLLLTYIASGVFLNLLEFLLSSKIIIIFIRIICKKSFQDETFETVIRWFSYHFYCLFLQESRLWILVYNLFYKTFNRASQFRAFWDLPNWSFVKLLEKYFKLLKGLPVIFELFETYKRISELHNKKLNTSSNSLIKLIIIH